jgi:hypothetical protein
MENVELFVRSEGKAQGEGKRLVCSLHLAEFRKAQGLGLRAQGARVEISFQTLICIKDMAVNRGQTTFFTALRLSDILTPLRLLPFCL